MKCYINDVSVTFNQNNYMRSQYLLENSQLQIKLKLNKLGKTIITHKYSDHPLCVSRPFYLDDNQNRAYLYLGNNSPGLFPGDDLNITLYCEQNTRVYLTDRAATKVYPNINLENIAKVNYNFNLASGAYLEFVPESLILYRDGALEQVTKINMDSTSSLFFSEIILPGRLARGESYLFHSYFNRLQVYSNEGDLWFSDAMYLSGVKNSFTDSHLFAKYPILGNAIVVLPKSNLKLLQEKIELLDIPDNLLTATSLLPSDRGLLIKINARKTFLVKQYFASIINSIRNINVDTDLPYIPK